MLVFSGLFFFVTMVMLLAFVPFVFWLIALLDVARAPEAAFGPPHDNGKNAWLLGVGVSLALGPLALVTTILWWVQGRPALRAGGLVPRPFWAPGRA
jgi:hypothetical protein